MFSYLLDRDFEDGLRFDARTFVLSDGQTQTITAYRLVWRWFDRLVAYEFAPDAPDIIQTAEEIAQAGHMPLGVALGHAVARHVYELEHLGGDITDDDLALTAKLRNALGNIHKSLARSPFPE